MTTLLSTIAVAALMAGSPALAADTKTAAPAASTAPAAPAAPAAAASDDSGTMERADADMKKVLETLAALGGKPIETLSAEEARQQPTPADAVMKLIKDENIQVPEPKVTKQDVMYPAGAGEQPARIYTPTEGTGPFPLVVYVHGGGWVIATIDTYDASAAAMAEKLGAVVVSLEYRHAPEHKFPASHDDVLAGYKWAIENSGQWNADPERLALIGESVGGNMVVATAIAARDQKLTQADAIVSVYPVSQTNMDTESYKENANAKPLNKAMMMWFAEKATSDPSQLKDPRISLVDADLKDLPPVTIINAEIDPLRSDGEMLAEKLKAAGNKATQTTYEGTVHEFFGMAAVVEDARKAQQEAVDAVKAAWGK